MKGVKPGAKGAVKAGAGPKKASSFDRPPEGTIRRSQMITTYGPGSMVDLIDDAVLVWGLDNWRYDRRSEVIDEQRLRERLAPRLAAHGIKLATQGYFRAPPDGNDQQPLWSRAVKATVFPLWMVCQNPRCRRLLRSDLLARKRDRYVHDCTKTGSLCVPVRFVSACPAGHLDEFPWVWFVHHVAGKCEAPALELHEGHTGDFSGVEVRCACGARRRLVDAKLEEKLMPRCLGRRPWLGSLGKEDCDERAQLMMRTASNSYFSVVESALSIPEEGSKLHDRVKDQWAVLGSATMQTIAAFRTIPAVKEAVDGFSDEQVIEAVAQVKAGHKPPREEIRRAEYKRLASADFYKPGDLPAPQHPPGDFYARRLGPERLTAPLPAGVAGVTLAYKLREVRVQLGFTRFSPIPRDIKGEGALEGGDVKLAPLGLATDWLPAVEIKGEGIFIELDEAAVKAWERRPEVLQWEAELAAGFGAWAAKSNSGAEFPGARFYMLHSLAHLLITQLSLECGYAASSIRERIYCDGKSPSRPMAAILLSTGTPGTEGTLGGLVEQGERIGHHLRMATELGALCSNDPVCAQHNPRGDLAERHHDGAACYACLFISESSCEWFNRSLDRSLVVPAIGQPVGRAFFGPGAFPRRSDVWVAPLPVEEPVASVDAGETEDASGWDAVRAESLLGDDALIAALEAAAVPLPVVGEELPGGVVAELAWHGTQVAVVNGDAGAEVEALRAAGWRVFVAPVAGEVVVAAIRGSVA